MQAKKKRLESLTKNYMKGSQHKLEQLWNNYHSQRFYFLFLTIQENHKLKETLMKLLIWVWSQVNEEEGMSQLNDHVAKINLYSC